MVKIVSESPESAVSRRGVPRDGVTTKIARISHSLLTHGEPQLRADLRRQTWDDHVEDLLIAGEPRRAILWEVLRSAVSHLYHRSRTGSMTFLPAGFGLLLAAFVGLATSLQGASAPQRPIVYLHLSVALFVLGAIFVARPLTPHRLGLRVSSVLLGTALVHLAIGYAVVQMTDFIFYPSAVAMFVGCFTMFLWSIGTRQRRMAEASYLLFTGGLLGFVVLIVARSFSSSSPAFAVTFLLAGFAAALVANFLLRCRAWLTTRT